MIKKAYIVLSQSHRGDDMAYSNQFHDIRSNALWPLPIYRNRSMEEADTATLRSLAAPTAFFVTFTYCVFLTMAVFGTAEIHAERVQRLDESYQDEMLAWEQATAAAQEDYEADLAMAASTRVFWETLAHEGQIKLASPSAVERAALAIRSIVYASDRLTTAEQVAALEQIAASQTWLQTFLEGQATFETVGVAAVIPALPAPPIETAVPTAPVYPTEEQYTVFERARNIALSPIGIFMFSLLGMIGYLAQGVEDRKKFRNIRLHRLTSERIISYAILGICWLPRHIIVGAWHASQELVRLAMRRDSSRLYTHFREALWLAGHPYRAQIKRLRAKVFEIDRSRRAGKMTDSDLQRAVETLAQFEKFFPYRSRGMEREERIGTAIAASRSELDRFDEHAQVVKAALEEVEQELETRIIEAETEATIPA